eukprot:TRINITY_DN6155_c0_g1_i2.p1 TRINITY_DN6155_c0_g1~~TRINITY_DN6155_c0_g1_i2.p1  ORF type:complete len:144 (+),score=35.56 TRINITY_DN6155_c0_g1_i2:38-433(+)
MRKLNYDKQDPSQYKKLKRNFDKVKEENIDLKNKAKTSDQRMAQLERELVDLKDTLKKNANASPNPSSSAAGAGERVVEASHQEPEDIKVGPFLPSLMFQWTWLASLSCKEGLGDGCFVLACPGASLLIYF